MEYFSGKELTLCLSSHIFRRVYQRLAARLLLGEKLNEEILETIEEEVLSEVTREPPEQCKPACLAEKAMEVALIDARVTFDAMHRLAAFRAH